MRVFAIREIADWVLERFVAMRPMALCVLETDVFVIMFAVAGWVFVRMLATRETAPCVLVKVLDMRAMLVWVFVEALEILAVAGCVFVTDF